MTAPVAAARRIALRENVVSVDDDELGRLLDALVRLDLRDADTVVDQIAALRLAGGVIGLMPTEAEVAALELGLEALAAEARPLGPALSRLAAVCAGEELSGQATAG